MLLLEIDYRLVIRAPATNHPLRVAQICDVTAWRSIQQQIDNTQTGERVKLGFLQGMFITENNRSE